MIWTDYEKFTGETKLRFEGVKLGRLIPSPTA